jgi:phosphopantetheinyl transferase
MPLIYEEFLKLRGHSYGVWQVEENVEFFEARMQLFDVEKHQVEDLTPRKKLEWYASRYLMHVLLKDQDRQPCVKDKFGKPHIKNSDVQVSLSHSKDLTSVIIGPSMVGIDIQTMVPKIDRIKHKYMSQIELDAVAGKPHYLEYLHIYWGAKEALYKAYGRRGVDFIKQLIIDPFDYNDCINETKGYVLKDNFIGEFKIMSKTINDAILVYAIEI